MKKFILITIFLSIFCSIIYAENYTDEVKTKIGKKFVIKLKSNPTTGYSWDYSFKSDEGIIKLLDKKYIPDLKYKNLQGGGGQEIFRFKALSNGKSELLFKYRRPCEKDVKEIEAKIFKIVVGNEKNK